MLTFPVFFPANCSSEVEENRIQKINFLDIVKRVINSIPFRNLRKGGILLRIDAHTHASSSQILSEVRSRQSLVVEAIALDPQGLRVTVQKMFRGCTKQHLCYVTPIQQGLASV